MIFRETECGGRAHLKGLAVARHSKRPRKAPVGNTGSVSSQPPDRRPLGEACALPATTGLSYSGGFAYGDVWCCL